MKIKKTKKISLLKIGSVITIFILFFTIFFINKFNDCITPKLLKVATASINKLNETILTNYRVKEIYKEVDLENCIKIVKNKNDEILTVDFDLENVYKALSIITEYLEKNLRNIETRKDILTNYQKEMSSKLDSIVLTLPIGLATNKIYFANLGPRIPVRVSYMGYLASSIRIKLEDYGINNTLISIYIDCSISNEFIIPFQEKVINHEYNILISSKIIQGIVPSYYGGFIERKSNILSLPIN